MKCLRCNEIIDINDYNCSHCGEQVTDLQRINYLDYQYYLKNNELKKVNSHIRSIIIITIILVLFIFMSLVFKESNDILIGYFVFIMMCIAFLIYKYGKKTKILNELKTYQLNINKIQTQNSFEICENCGSFKYSNMQCNNCNYNKIDNKKGNDRYSLKELSRAKTIVNILIFIGMFIAFGIAGNWESNYFETHHDDTAGWVLLFEIIPAILLVAGILFAISNSFFNKKIKSEEYKTKIRD